MSVDADKVKGDDQSDLLQAMVAYGHWVREDIARFRQAFPDLGSAQTPMPQFTWEQLERQFSFLTSRADFQAAIPHRVSAIRKLSAWKPAEMTLQEIMLEAWLLLDESPAPPVEDEEDYMP